MKEQLTNKCGYPRRMKKYVISQSEYDGIIDASMKMVELPSEISLLHYLLGDVDETNEELLAMSEDELIEQFTMSNGDGCPFQMAFDVEANKQVFP